MIKRRAYVKNATESFGLLLLLKSGSKITREAVKKETEKNKKGAQKFFEAFFEAKKNLIKQDTEKFCRFYGAYKFIVPLVNKISKNSEVYIVTSNKKSAITPVLKAEGLRIDNRKILDATISEDKKILLEIIEKRENTRPGNIVFVDDSLEHLKLVSVGGRLLASWGYVLKEDLQQAKKLGITIATKDNVGHLLQELSSS